jgi:hypothetical protein
MLKFKKMIVRILMNYTRIHFRERQIYELKNSPLYVNGGSYPSSHCCHSCHS